MGASTGRSWPAHTEEKLGILRDYLRAFALATTGAPQRVFIDAFAGGGQNVLRETGTPLEGSPEIALGVEPPFTHVSLFEQPRHEPYLRRLKEQHGQGRMVDIHIGDCNALMREALGTLPRRAPTFAYLDPDGLDLHWSTVEQLASHKRDVKLAQGRPAPKVEQWILLATSSVVRALGAGNWKVVERVYGARGPWEAVWRARLRRGLSAARTRQALLFLYMDRLDGLGYAHLLHRPILMGASEFYVMVFASDHFLGEKLMGWIQAQPRLLTQEGVLFNQPKHPPPVQPYSPDWREDFPANVPRWEEGG